MVRVFEQQEGVDVEETFAPVVAWETISSLLAITTQNDWNISHMDIITAFLHGPCREEVYVTQSEGFQVPGNEHLVYRLRKALYGLRQVPRSWYEKIDKFLKQIGFKPGTGDHNFYSRIEDQHITLIALCVDDLLMVSNSSSEIKILKARLHSKFPMTGLSEENIMIYLKAECIRVQNVIFLTQRS